jgi:hypothetical protein
MTMTVNRVPELRAAFIPPPEWAQWCAENASLFHSPAWHLVLKRGFAAKALYIWEAEGDTAFAINIFKVGPFRIGYLGFPIGGALSGKPTPEHLDALRLTPHPFDLLRIPVSGFGTPLEPNLISVAVPETAITNLAEWRLSALPKLHRDLNRAQRTPITVRDLNHNSYAQVYELYCSTVLSRGGSLRYTPAYFQALLELAEHCGQVRCIAAFHDQEMAGFIITVQDKNTGYYLHGATARAWKSRGISDLLVCTALDWAQHLGMTSFNLMTSPPSQPGLIRYKEKFGAQTRAHLTYEFRISPFRAHAFRFATWAHDLLRR